MSNESVEFSLSIREWMFENQDLNLLLTQWVLPLNSE
jgi:hypothetical protein